MIVYIRMLLLITVLVVVLQKAIYCIGWTEWFHYWYQYPTLKSNCERTNAMEQGM